MSTNNTINLDTKLSNIKSLTYFSKIQNKEKKVLFNDKRQELFEHLHLNTVSDLLYYFPRRYKFLQATTLQNGHVFIEGQVKSIVKVNFYKPKQSRSSFDFQYQNQLIKVVIFHRHFLKAQLENSSVVSISGNYDEKTNTLTASDIYFEPIKKLEGIQTYYALPKSIKQNSFHELQQALIKNVYTQILDIIPQSYQEKYQILNSAKTILGLHFPSSEKELSLANTSMIYQEFFIYAMQTIIENNSNENATGYAKDIDKNDIPNFLQKINYELTDDQKHVLNEIYLDLKNDHPMNRLLLADVGSGKTLVALIACYMVFMSGYQCAFMAPTTILATQNYYEALKVLKEVEINVALLTGSTSNAERKVILDDLKRGKIDLLIGTHALFQKDVEYKSLGLVIFDEQQRFGVAQRQALKDKGQHVDSLMLSATPIPRTLAQNIYSSLKISTMEKALPFKKPIQSFYFKSNSIKPFMDQMLAILNKKQQVYIVTPLVEENEENDNKNALGVYKNISEYFKDQYKVALLYGGMKNEEKDEIMINFANHEYDILVATSLIEVGISVANANCMIIYDAHRFGLSQLHQLRGRVGRGKEQGYCVFLSNSDDPKAIEKLEFITKTNNGFEIAEYDLKTRGPGDILGIKQSGLPSFYVADIVKHHKVFRQAYLDANELFNQQDEFKKWYKEHQSIINNFEFYQEV